MPLLDELQCLSERCSDIILIDDARFFLSAPLPPHDPQQWRLYWTLCPFFNGQNGVFYAGH